MVMSGVSGGLSNFETVNGGSEAVLLHNICLKVSDNLEALIFTFNIQLHNLHFTKLYNADHCHD